MKIFTNLLLCVLVLCALSCTKDDSQIDQNSLEGSWEVVEVKCHDGVYSTTENGISFGGAFIASGKEISTQLHFYNDGSVEGNGTYTQVYNMMRQGEMHVSEDIRNDFDLVGTWTKIDDQLELTHQDIQQFEVIGLNGLELELKGDFQETINIGDATTIKSGSYHYKLKRIQ